MYGIFDTRYEVHLLTLNDVSSEYIQYLSSEKIYSFQYLQDDILFNGNAKYKPLILMPAALFM